MKHCWILASTSRAFRHGQLGRHFIALDTPVKKTPRDRTVKNVTGNLVSVANWTALGSGCWWDSNRAYLVSVQPDGFLWVCDARIHHPIYYYSQSFAISDVTANLTTLQGKILGTSTWKRFSRYRKKIYRNRVAEKLCTCASVTQCFSH